MNHRVKLLPDPRPKEMADPLSLRPIDNTNRPLQPLLSHHLCIPHPPQHQQKISAHVMKRSLPAPLQRRPHPLELRRLVPIRRRRHCACVCRKFHQPRLLHSPFFPHELPHIHLNPLAHLPNASYAPTRRLWSFPNDRPDNPPTPQASPPCADHAHSTIRHSPQTSIGNIARHWRSAAHSAPHKNIHPPPPAHRAWHIPRSAAAAPPAAPLLHPRTLCSNQSWPHIHTAADPRHNDPGTNSESAPAVRPPDRPSVNISKPPRSMCTGCTSPSHRSPLSTSAAAA